MTDAEREAALKRLDQFVAQQHRADETADKGSLDRAADIVALYEDRSWVAEMPAPKVTRNRGRPVDPESFSRFTKWLAQKTRVAGRTAYQLRAAHEVAANYLRDAQINPAGEHAVRPLKWLTKNDHSDRVVDVWNLACELAGNKTPDEPTVRRALAQWKKDNLPKKATSKTTGGRRGRALASKCRRDFADLMEQYPELVVATLNEIEADAARRFNVEIVEAA